MAEGNHDHPGTKRSVHHNVSGSPVHVDFGTDALLADTDDDEDKEDSDGMVVDDDGSRNHTTIVSDASLHDQHRAATTHHTVCGVAKDTAVVSPGSSVDDSGENSVSLSEFSRRRARQRAQRGPRKPMARIGDFNFGEGDVDDHYDSSADDLLQTPPDMPQPT